jgi:hypothetical protein
MTLIQYIIAIAIILLFLTGAAIISLRLHPGEPTAPPEETVPQQEIDPLEETVQLDIDKQSNPGFPKALRVERNRAL